MTQLQKYGVIGGVVIALIVALVVVINIWDSNNITAGRTAERQLWKDSLAAARHIHKEFTDSIANQKPPQIFSFTNKPRTRTAQEQAYIDSISSAKWIEGYESFKESYQYVLEKLDTVVALPTKDTVHVQYDPLTHQGTIGLISSPTYHVTTTISDSVIVGMPCPEIPWYDSSTAWFGYGATAVLVTIEVYQLATK